MKKNQRNSVASRGLSAHGGQSPAAEEMFEDQTRQLQMTERERFLAEVVETANMPFGVGAPDGRLLMFNKAFADLTGYSREELHARRMTWAIDLTPEEWRASENTWLAEAVRTHQPVRYEKEYLRKDGTRVPIELFVQPAFDAAGELLHYRCFLTDITARKQAEAALCASEERMRFALETIHTGAWDLDLVDHSTFRSLDHDRIFGYAQLLPQWTYEMFLEHVLPEDRAAVDGKFRQAMENKGDWNFESRIRRADGEVRWIMAAGRHTKDAAGNSRRMAGVVQDITERKQAEAARRQRAEEELRLSEQEFRLLAESVPQIVWATRPDGWTIYFNQHWVDYTGMTMEESYGPGWNTPFHPDDKPRAWEAWQQATQHNERYSLECRLRRHDGVYRWWLIRGEPLRGANGEILKWFGTCTDIEEIKNNEAALEQRVAERTAALRESEERFRAVAANTPDHILMQDRDLRYQMVTNPQLGLTEADMVGRTDQDFLEPEDARKLMEIKRRVIDTGKPVSLETPLRNAKGEMEYFEGTYVPKVDSAGKAVGIIGYFRNITQRKQAEDNLRRHAEELARFNRAMVDRELRMIELKKQVNELCARLGQPKLYPLEFEKECPPPNNQ